MQIHQIQRPKQKIRRRVGRGGTRGNYSGRGIKGQNARAGSSRRPAIRDFIRKIPKLPGVPAARYKKQGSKQYDMTYEVVNLDALNKKFKDGEVVSPETLLGKKLLRRIKGRMPNVKILGRGALKKKLIFERVAMSQSVHSKLK
jgi:large subunit ribosomal protein L15